jgi:hypothetical protein
VIIPILGMNCLMEREDTSEKFDNTGAIYISILAKNGNIV